MRRHYFFASLIFILVFLATLTPQSVLADGDPTSTPDTQATTTAPSPTPIVGDPTATLTSSVEIEATTAPTSTTPTPTASAPASSPTRTEEIPEATLSPTQLLEPTPGQDEPRMLLQNNPVFSSNEIPETLMRRGFNPDYYWVTYYDTETLIDIILPSERYAEPIDFRLDCSGEEHPYTGCMLSDRLSDGRNYSVKWSSELLVPEDGDYTFYFDDVDDGAALYFGSNRVMDQGWYWPIADVAPSPQTIYLTKGWHEVEIVYEQRIFNIASLQVSWSGPSFSKEIIPIASKSLIRVLSEDNLTTLQWNGIIFDELNVEAIIYEDKSLDAITANVSTEQSGFIKDFTLYFHETLEAGVHVYRGSLNTSEIIQRTGDLMVSTIINEAVDFDYNVAVEYMDKLGIPENSRMGIALGIGLEGSYPPSSLDFMRAGGYEIASVSLVNYKSANKIDFYIQNQADVLLYLGHGDHNDNYIHSMEYTENNEKHFDRINPSDIEGHWDKNLETIILFGCSVLDINDLNNVWVESSSPGIEWVSENPQPKTWLGFQFSAPLLYENDGDELLYKHGDKYVKNENWIKSWKQASREVNPFKKDEFGEWIIVSRKYSGAVAIDMEKLEYYYWKQFPILVNGREFSPINIWKSVPYTEWGKSSNGLEILVASPVEIHIYDHLGRHLGINDQGEYEAEIPGSSTELVPINEDETHQGRIFSIDAADISLGFDVVVVGTGNGTFDLLFEIPDRQKGITINSGYTSIPIQIELEYELHLGPNIASDFSLQASNGEDILSPELIIKAMDLPLNLNVDGDMNTLGWYTSDVTVYLAPSDSYHVHEIQQIEYDMGEGWQIYTQPIFLTANGEYHLSYRAVFEDGTYDITQKVSFKIDKRNTPPIANAGPDLTISEGSISNLNSAGSIDPDGDLITSYDWEILQSSGPSLTLIQPTDPSPLFFAVDDGEYLVQLTVTDEHDAEGSDLVSLTIINEAPVVDAGNDMEVGYSELVQFQGSFSDLGFLDTHQIQWDFGDSSTAEGSLTPSHIYNYGGDYTIVLTVIDDDGGQGSDELIVTVENRPPEIGDIYQSYAEEGKSFETTVVFSDPDSYSWSASVDYGDGSAVEDIESLENVEIPILHTYLNQGEYGIRVCVNDAEGNTSCASFQIYVSNLPPMMSLPDTINAFEGSQLELEPIPFSDSGVFDSHTAKINWGDGSPSETMELTEQDGSGTVLGTHLYQDDGMFEIEICVADTDNGESCGNFNADVSNLPPQLSLGPLGEISEGQVYQLQEASFVDPGVLDTHSSTVDWKDGTAVETLEVVEADGSGTVHGEHFYRDNEEYPITICVMDNNQDEDCAELPVSVTNEPPEVYAGADQIVSRDSTVIFEGSFQDPGLDDTHEIVWDFGDGSTAEGSLNPTHVYQDTGEYIVELTVTDDDGGVDSDQVKITITQSSQNRLVLSDIKSDRCMWIDLDTGDYHWFEEDGQKYTGEVNLTQLRFILLFRSDRFDQNYVRGFVIRNQHGNAVLFNRDSWHWRVFRIIDRNVNDQSVCP